MRIPKLRIGSFFPALLHRRRRIDQALFAVVMEAYVHGVSARKVDDPVAALGIGSGISRSEVSRIFGELDDQVAAFRGRSLAARSYPYVFHDATHGKARVDHQVVSQAVVVAIGVRADGHREVLGVDVGDSKNGAFWTQFSAQPDGARAGRVCVPRTVSPCPTLLSIDCVGMASGRDRPYYSGKHKRHGVNVQVLADPAGRLISASPALPGARHDMGTARPTSRPAAGACHASRSRSTPPAPLNAARANARTCSSRAGRSSARSAAAPTVPHLVKAILVLILAT